MILYEVSVTVRSDLSQGFEAYMRGKHLPEIWASQCFMQIRFDKASETLFRTCYQAATWADYERYLHQYAPAFRADFMAHFPEGCTPSREVYEAVQIWN